MTKLRMDRRSSILGGLLIYRRKQTSFYSILDSKRCTKYLFYILLYCYFIFSNQLGIFNLEPIVVVVVVVVHTETTKTPLQVPVFSLEKRPF